MGIDCLLCIFFFFSAPFTLCHRTHVPKGTQRSLRPGVRLAALLLELLLELFKLLCRDLLLGVQDLFNALDLLDLSDTPLAKSWEGKKKRGKDGTG